MTWIDFKRLKERLDFRAVLKAYGVEVKGGGDRHQGVCPLPNHEGTRRSSFSAHLNRRIFQCFGCGAKGNVLDFAILMEGKNPNQMADVRAIALKLQQQFGIAAEKAPAKTPGPAKPPVKASSPAPRPATNAQPVLVNPPLDFELKDLDPDHPYLKERGFTDETIKHFGLGFCNRGFLKGRIAIPLHNGSGQPIGYAGRLTQDQEICERNPKYLFPGTRERQGKTIEFRPSLFLYNFHRLKKPVDDLIIVQGFPAVWWLWQCGYKDVVAVISDSFSQEQTELIISVTTPSHSRLWIIAEKAQSDFESAPGWANVLILHRFTRCVTLDHMRVTDIASDELDAMMPERC